MKKMVTNIWNIFAPWTAGQTWNLSNILHGQIFGPTILHSKNMYIAAIFANIKAEYKSIWVSLVPFFVEIEMNM